MDYSCRDIPMRLDINNQPLNFDIYLSQVTDIPRTSSLEEEPYDFSTEIGALAIVDKIINRTAITTTNSTKQQHQQQQLNQPADHTPLTPIKSSIHQPEQIAAGISHGSSGSDSNTNNNAKPQDTSKSYQVNPREFEDINYDPFDHLELQTIDELRELNLVFQASSNSVNSIHQKSAPPEASP